MESNKKQRAEPHCLLHIECERNKGLLTTAAHYENASTSIWDCCQKRLSFLERVFFFTAQEPHTSASLPFCIAATCVYIPAAPQDLTFRAHCLCQCQCQGLGVLKVR